MRVRPVTCHTVVVKDIELRTGVRGQSEYCSRGSRWHKARGCEVSRARKNVKQKGVSKDINEWMQK
jgi:hypothetical protein